MRIRLLTILIAVVFAATLVVGALAQDAKKDAAKHEYVGVNKCKICHKKDNTYTTWVTTKHAFAYDSLTAEQKKDTSLLKYYTTGTTAAGELLTNIQCEACHGPGSDYKTMSIMKDKAKAEAAGLNLPTAETCMKCHNAKAPAKLAALLDKDGKFDFAANVKKGVHAMPKMEEGK